MLLLIKHCLTSFLATLLRQLHAWCGSFFRSCNCIKHGIIFNFNSIAFLIISLTWQEMAPLSGCYRILDGVCWTEHPVAPYPTISSWIWRYSPPPRHPHLRARCREPHVFNKSYRKSNSDETYIAGTWYLVVLGFRKSWTSNGQNLDFSPGINDSTSCSIDALFHYS